MKTNCRSCVLEVKVTWRTIVRNDDWGPCSGTEGTTEGPGMIVVTADEMQGIAGVATRMVAQQAS